MKWNIITSACSVMSLRSRLLQSLVLLCLCLTCESLSASSVCLCSFCFWWASSGALPFMSGGPAHRNNKKWKIFQRLFISANLFNVSLTFITNLKWPGVKTNIIRSAISTSWHLKTQWTFKATIDVQSVSGTWCALQAVSEFQKKRCCGVSKLAC